jgi:hypothetical protein
MLFGFLIKLVIVQTRKYEFILAGKDEDPRSAIKCNRVKKHCCGDGAVLLFLCRSRSKLDMIHNAPRVLSVLGIEKLCEFLTAVLDSNYTPDNR